MNISNKTLLALIIVSFIVSITGFLYMQRTNQVSASGTTGIIKVNILTSAQFNVSTPTIDFGNGSITVNTRNCTLASENKSKQTPSGCWNGTFAGSQKQGFNVVNLGNTYLNISIKSMKNASLSSGSTSFWGTSAGDYRWKCYATGANGTSQITTYKRIQNYTKAQVCVYKLNFTAGLNAATVHINISIPDTALGQKNDTIVFSGIRSCQGC